MNDKTNMTIIGDTKIHGRIQYAAGDRVDAVGIALELIKSSCAGTGSGHLRGALDRLSQHADTIQAALKESKEQPS